MIALELLLDIAQGIFRTPFIKLVDRNDVGVVEHVDLFQLTGRAIFGGHHIHGDVRKIDDFSVGLTDA